MQCYIYRSSIKDGLYVYLAVEDGLDTLPEPVKKQLGDAEFAMALELTTDRKLGQEDTIKVMENLKNQGFHLQMPRDLETQLERLSSLPLSGKTEP